MNLRRVASFAGALVVAAIAALASYSHMRGLAVRYGQPELIADMLPVSVDGMMVVATVALGDGRRHRWSAWLAFWTGVGASVVANVLAAEPSAVARCISAWPAVAFLLVVEVITRAGHAGGMTEDAPTAEVAVDVAPASRETATVHQDEAAVQRETVAPRRRRPAKPIRRPIGETKELAASLRAQFPTMTQAELAQRLGISATRLRQVERAERGAADGQRPVNGVAVESVRV